MSHYMNALFSVLFLTMNGLFLKWFCSIRKDLSQALSTYNCIHSEYNDDDNLFFAYRLTILCFRNNSPCTQLVALAANEQILEGI